MSKFSSQSMLNLFHFTKEQETGYFLPQDLWLAYRLKRCLENGINIHETTPNATTYPQKNFDGYQVIHYAAYYGLRHVYQVAKNAGANLETKVGFLEETPFQIIARRINANYKLFNSQKAYEYLAFKMIGEGVNIHETDNVGYTPLHRTESVKLIQKLIEMKVNINAVNKNGENALHRAVLTYLAFNNPSHDLSKRYAFIQEQAYQKALLLIKAGINIHQKNKAGKTPFDLIQNDYWNNYNNSKMYQLLKEALLPYSKITKNNRNKRAICSRILDWQRD